MKLVIVESPTKAKTISRFLGKDFTVTSSQGHVRDLPKSDLGVDVQNNYEPVYEVPTRSKATVAELKRLAKDAEIIYFATDEDREGEAISWHLVELLKPKASQIQRIVFHEITESALKEALQHPRSLDTKLVDAQQARRVLDRLVGYELSPFLWQKIRYGLSAGRVQSVAVRLIVEREREIRAFVPQEYWTITGEFNTTSNERLQAELTHLGGEKLDKFSIANQSAAEAAVDTLEDATWSIGGVEQKETKRSPLPPYTTSTLQQDANRRLGFVAKRTMTVAQKLYEGIDVGNGPEGLITYMRTDSLSLSEKFISEAAGFIAAEFGSTYTTGPRHYKTNKKGAQEAHEAIRPTDVKRTPASVEKYLEPDQYKLYELIWSRAVASQMSESTSLLTKINIVSQDGKHQWKSSGSVMVFDGFTKVYGGEQKDELLPKVSEKDTLAVESVRPEQHFTEPPARYNDASLVKALEEHGIGRPSTYAPTINTIIEREYVIRNEAKRFEPTDTAYIVNDLLTQYFSQIVDVEFTARMENELDEIATGEKEWRPVIDNFYTPFHKNLEEVTKKVAKEDILPSRLLGTDPATGEPVYVRTGRFGSYVQRGEYDASTKKKKDAKKTKNVSLLPGMSLETATMAQAQELLSLPKQVGTDKDGHPINVAIGRFGPYLTANGVNITLPADKSPLALDKAFVEQFFEEKKIEKIARATPLKILGTSPVTQQEVQVRTGKFGPYVTDGVLNASLGKKFEVEAITLEEALTLLEKKLAAMPEWKKKKLGQKKAVASKQKKKAQDDTSAATSA